MQKLPGRFKLIILLSIFFLTVIFPTQSFSQVEPSTPKLKDVLTESENDEPHLQSTSTVNVEPKKLIKAGPNDEYDRGVPRNSVAGYFKAAKSGDYKRAANYLDLRNLPRGYSRKDGTELSRQLKVVLDRSLWVEMDLLSKKQQGHSNDGLPSYRDLVGQINANGKTYDILLQHVPRKDGIFIWKFSSKTVREIPELYKTLGYGPIGESLSQYLPEYDFMGLYIWQWVFLILIILAVAVVTMPLTRLTGWLIRRRKTELNLMMADIISGPLNIVLILIITRQNFDLVHPSLTAQVFFQGRTTIIIAFLWLLISIVNLFHKFYSQKLISRNQEHTVVLLGPALTTLKIIIIFLGLLVWLDNIGFSVTTVLAGLGIGGIAIALATQKSIENFIGAITLYLAAPVKVGDFCKFADKMGEIEEIGLRGTKIRTLENTVLIVPNAEFVSMQIENFAEREKFRFSPGIRLHSKTTPKQLRCILSNIKESLNVHNKVLESPLRVNFSGFGEHSLDIEIHCYIDTLDLHEYKNISEDLNLHIMDIIQSAGTRIAIPTSIEYREQETESSLELKQQAEQQVKKFRKAQEE